MHEERELQEHRLNSWEDFEAKVADFDRETRGLKRSRSRVGGVSKPIYRGQRDATWRLETTLDRRRPGMTLGKYLTLIERIQPRIEQVSRRTWPALNQEISGLRSRGLDSIWLFPVTSANTMTILSFMVYLRQHGFPSPLLDWTSDPYRAAFFAFAGVEEGADRVAIFTFREWTGTPRDCRRTDEPTAMTLSPYIRNTSPRHLKQRAQYTWCIERLASGSSLEDYVFADHEGAIDLPGFRIEKDVAVSRSRVGNVVEKYTIPTSDLRKVLASLAKRSINRCRLFGQSADNLLEDLWNESKIECAV
jgi:hypothetical protein